MTMIAVLALLARPAEPEAILAAMVDRYSRVERAQGTVVHVDRRSEEPTPDRTYKFTWEGDLKFEVRPVGGDPFAGFYRGDGRTVLAIFPDQRRIPQDTRQRPSHIFPWEAQAGLVFSMLEGLPLVKELLVPPKSSERTFTWGERKEMRGHPVRELVIQTTPRHIHGTGEENQSPPPNPITVTLYLHDYRPELIAYSFIGDPDKMLVYYQDLSVTP